MKILIRQLCLLLLFLQLPGEAFAESDELSRLATHPTWLKLLKYEPSTDSPTGWRSAIHADAFFLSPSGVTDPLAELQASVSQFVDPSVDSANEQHPTCRFPARYMWLASELTTSSNFVPMATCSEYNKWILQGETESVSFVLATGYLENPASFYGHTILKLNSSRSRNTKDIEDVSVNYGAIVPDGDDPVTYIFKGIFGGYEAGFSDSDYYFHTHNYGETELRDMWEYELNLTKDEVDLFLAHAWEVIGKEYTYYFFRKNCGYRMAEMLELIPGVEIIPNNPFFIMPQVLIQRLNSAQRNEEPLVKRVALKQSRQSKLYEGFGNLSQTHQELLRDIAENPNVLNQPVFLGLDPDSKGKILEVLISYYLFLQKKTPENKEIDEIYRKVLTLRFGLPVGPNLKTVNEKEAPHEGRNPSRISVGGAYNSRLANAGIIHLRPAYYDELDAGAAHVSNSSLSMGEVKLSIFNDNIDIRQLDFVSLSSFNANATNLPGDEMETWSLAAGIRAQRRDCENCESLYFEAAKGRGFDLSSNSKLVIEAGAGVQDERQQLGNLYGSISMKLMSQITTNIALKTQIQSRYFYDGETANDLKFSLDLRYLLSINNDIRLSYESHFGSSLYIDWGVYF